MSDFLMEDKITVARTIQDVIRENFDRQLSISLFVFNRLDKDRSEWLDKSVKSIFFGTELIDRYVRTVTTSTYVPLDKKKVKAYCLFVDEFDDYLNNKQHSKIIDCLVKSDIVILSLELASLSDFALYYKFIDYIDKFASSFDGKAVCNLLVTKTESAPNNDLETSRLNRYFSFPQGSMVIWIGDSVSQLRGNIAGFEEIVDGKSGTFASGIDACINNSLLHVLHKSNAIEEPKSINEKE